MYRQKAKMAWNTVMSQELTLVSQTEQVVFEAISKLYVKSTHFMPRRIDCISISRENAKCMMIKKFIVEKYFKTRSR